MMICLWKFPSTFSKFRIFRSHSESPVVKAAAMIVPAKTPEDMSIFAGIDFECASKKISFPLFCSLINFFYLMAAR